MPTDILWWEQTVQRNRGLFVKVKFVKQVSEPVKIYSSTGKLTIYFKLLAYGEYKTHDIFYMLKLDQQANQQDFVVVE